MKNDVKQKSEFLLQVVNLLVLVVALAVLLPRLRFSKALVVWMLVLGFVVSVAFTWYRLYKVQCPLICVFYVPSAWCQVPLT